MITLNETLNLPCLVSLSFNRHLLVKKPSDIREFAAGES